MQKSKDVLIFAKIYCNMKCIADILILFVIRDIKRLWLGGGYYGAPVVLEVTDTMSYRYVMRDHLGSITHVYTAEPIPTLLQELSYDAWGRLRNPDTHEAYASGSVPTPILGRGYTGHRHIAGIGLIDMNARLYDPMLGRFLSPDPHIQSPDCPQNYNRYSYCLNNPLRYTDPTGEIIKIEGTGKTSELEDFLNSVPQDSWLGRLIQYFEDSDEVLYLRYGETVSGRGGSQLLGQYSATTNTITFLTGEYLNYSVLAEELYHAYQQQYATFGITWNREFEARVAVALLIGNILNVSYLDIGTYWGIPGMEGYFDNLWYDAMNGNFNFFQIYSPDFRFSYYLYGGIFADYYSNGSYTQNHLLNYSVPVSDIPDSFKNFITIILDE